MDGLRQQLGEECARQALAGRQPSAATLRLLRRVAWQELCLTESRCLCCEAGEAITVLGSALRECLLLRPDGLMWPAVTEPCPVGLGGYGFSALVLNSLWLLLQQGAGGAAVSARRAEGSLTLTLRSSRPCAHRPQWWGQPGKPMTDPQLAAAAVAHLARQGGGRALFYPGAVPGISLWLPLCRFGKGSRMYTAAQLLEDPFGPVHLFLAGFTAAP